MSVLPGEISAIIGPNGAGKTTLFNQITGHLLPDKGNIIFQEEDLIGQTPQEIVLVHPINAYLLL
ncbi:MAG: ATP-binding cassette domain-containing protein [Desulfobacter sp.]|nr:MAG: ATP-binding cassette domain-containing protein [Desulfobacter sp.]